MVSEQDNRERADALLGYHDAVLRERETADKVGKLIAALQTVHDPKIASSSTDHLVESLPEVRELLDARRTLKAQQQRCARMGLKTSLVKD